MDKVCSFFLNFEFLINCSSVLTKLFTLSEFNIFASVTVSGKPPLLVIITAQPFAEASRLVLPNGSSHLEQTTVILVFANIFNGFIVFLNISITKP